MNEQRLREELRAAHVPDGANAHLRARALVLAAHRNRPARRRGRPIAVRLLVAGGLVLATTSVAAATLDITRPAPHPPASLTDLPGGGRLLIAAGADAWVLGNGPAQRVRGVGDQVRWSAFGHYVARADGRTLQAVALSGRVAWSERYPAVVRDPRWSPDGNRIAVRAGSALYVTAADGTQRHAIRVRSIGAPPAWRPGRRHVLAVLTAPRRVALVDADSGAVASRMRAPAGTTALSWSRNGGRLLAVGRRTATVWTGTGRVVWRHTTGAAHFAGGQLSPAGDRAALLRRRAGGLSDVLLVGAHSARRLMSARALDELLFSPDGRWLLVGWRRLDSWLFFATALDDHRVRQVGNVSRRVGGQTATVEGWCCASR